MEDISLRAIHDDLQFLKRAVAEIKMTIPMMDNDFLLSFEEQQKLDESIVNFKKGKTRDFDEIKHKLGL